MARHLSLLCAAACARIETGFVIASGFPWHRPPGLVCEAIFSNAMKPRFNEEDCFAKTARNDRQCYFVVVAAVAGVACDPKYFKSGESGGSTMVVLSSMNFVYASSVRKN